MSFFGDVTTKKNGFTTRLLDPLNGIMGVMLLVEIADENVSTFAGKRDGYRFSNSTIGAGN